MANSSNSDPVVYHFVETETDRVLGVMSLKANFVGTGAWSSLHELIDHLDEGISSLQFWFPDQGTEGLSPAIEGFLEPAMDEDENPIAYGSSDGSEIDQGSFVGKVTGFHNDNYLMAMTFPEAGIGGESVGNSVATMDFGHDENGTGLELPGTGSDHAPKYAYVGKWKRV